MSFTSSCKELKYSVPQGSVLGHLLFLLFINGLPKAVQDAKIVLFADDTNILLIDKNHKSLNDKIKAAMNQIANWFAVNDLILNTEKTKALFFQGHSLSTIYKPDPYLNTKAITYTSNLKFLGIYITENLSWASHIRYLTQKLIKPFILSNPCVIVSIYQSQEMSTLINSNLYSNMVLYFGVGVKKKIK
jgi:hypothetical protein